MRINQISKSIYFISDYDNIDIRVVVRYNRITSITYNNSNISYNEIKEFLLTKNILTSK